MRIIDTKCVTISVKYLGPTSHKVARVKAFVAGQPERGSITRTIGQYDYDHTMDMVAFEFCEKNLVVNENTKLIKGADSKHNYYTVVPMSCEL